MLKKDATKKYLADKVKGYLDQGDKEMADRFIEAYLPITGGSPEEIMKMAKRSQNKIKPKKEEKKEGSEE
jgi:hypothetical protein